MEKMLEIMTPQQAADYLQVHVKTIYDWIKSGELKASKLGPRSVRIRKEDIERFLESHILEPGSEIPSDEEEVKIQNSNKIMRKVPQKGSGIETKSVKPKKVEKLE